MNQSIHILQPDDFHCHLRDGIKLLYTVIPTATQFGRAIIMPNLCEPVTDLSQAENYFKRIMQVVQGISTTKTFQPLMTLYLSQSTTPALLKAAKKNEHLIGVKLYPAHATTNSALGISDLNNLYPLLEVLEEIDLPLLIHGEIADPTIDIFDREAVFIDHYLSHWVAQFPNLRMVLEHISTQKAVAFVQESPATLAATITPHHLWLNRNDLLAGGLYPHRYCLPIVKTKTDQNALIQAATSGNPKFFLGTDSAPHQKNAKECAKVSAGIYNSPVALPTYAEIFEKANALHHLEAFASRNGALFYRLPLNSSHITLRKSAWQMPSSLPFGEKETVIPFRAGETIPWSVVINEHPFTP